LGQRCIVTAAVVVLSLPLWAGRRDGDAGAANSEPPVVTFAEQQAPPVLPPAALPRMAPELALQSFESRGQMQSAELAGYSDTTQVDALLPETAQAGSYELVREYVAPHELTFRPVRFTGDGFVKTNVITRLLQSEVDHVEKPADDVGINGRNYKFSYKGSEQIEGRAMHVFQLKPRRKVPGLFKGRIYLDAVTGTLRRAEGTLVKSPSFFIKKIEFVQDYSDIGNFTLPVKMHSTAVTRVVGRAVVDIFHRNYQARAVSAGATSAQPAQANAIH